MPLTEQQKTCLDCRVCCKYLVMNAGYEKLKDYQENMQFLANWGNVILSYGDNKHFEVAIPYPCKFLREDGCAIYEERPEVCRNNDIDKRGAFFKRNCKLGESNGT